MTVYDILSFLESESLSSFLFPWKVLFIILTIFFLIAIFYYHNKHGYLPGQEKRKISDFLSFQKFDSDKIFQLRSKKIASFLNKKDYKKAILMMEELLVDILKSRKVSGDNLLELIDNSPISDISELKNIYTIAEEIKDGQGYILNLEELEKLFASCEEALKRFKIIS
ncbi:MAG: hypothetical protein PHU17_00370 [Candidatus Pacebacteria bacterium]|nr:hypothetical protein [Candidatus Paceibacterota bacterium]